MRLCLGGVDPPTLHSGVRYASGVVRRDPARSKLYLICLEDEGFEKTVTCAMSWLPGWKREDGGRAAQQPVAANGASTPSSGRKA
jgi:hypothetical protein